MFVGFHLEACAHYAVPPRHSVFLTQPFPLTHDSWFCQWRFTEYIHLWILDFTVFGLNKIPEAKHSECFLKTHFIWPWHPHILPSWMKSAFKHSPRGIDVHPSKQFAVALKHIFTTTSLIYVCLTLSFQAVWNGSKKKHSFKFLTLSYLFTLSSAYNLLNLIQCRWDHANTTVEFFWVHSFMHTVEYSW